jgi:hypothetical protein
MFRIVLFLGKILASKRDKPATKTEFPSRVQAGLLSGLPPARNQNWSHRFLDYDWVIGFASPRAFEREPIQQVEDACDSVARVRYLGPSESGNVLEKIRERYREISRRLSARSMKCFD